MSLLRRCPVCASNSTETFLRRKLVPASQNQVMRSRLSAVEIPRGNLILGVCENCGFIYNQDFQPSILRYDEHYDNTQAYSPSFNAHLESLVHHLVSEKGIQNKRVVEVGCGQGLFLRKLVEAEGSGNSGYGFDPSYTGPRADLGGRLRFEERYYGPGCGDISADVVICRHVIEHVPEPLEMLGTMRRTLGDSPFARLFLETPRVEWILDNRVVWDFFYEHCSYFSAEALSTLLAATGFKIDSIQNVFGGQYLWVEATPSSGEQMTTSEPSTMPAMARQFADSEGSARRFLNDKLASFGAEGQVALWGAAAKGVTLANLVDPERDLIACVVDLNPNKQGNYIPGTGHPIVGPSELAEYGVKTAVVLNPNYRQEILASLHESRLNIQLIDLMALTRGADEADY